LHCGSAIANPDVTDLNKPIMAPFGPSDYSRNVVGSFIAMPDSTNQIVAAVVDDFGVRESISSLVESVGYTSLHRRVRLRRPELTVILISAHYGEETRQQALHQGAARISLQTYRRGEVIRNNRTGTERFRGKVNTDISTGRE
jgi:hypothetical protein